MKPLEMICAGFADFAMPPSNGRGLPPDWLESHVRLMAFVDVILFQGVTFAVNLFLVICLPMPRLVKGVALLLSIIMLLRHWLRDCGRIQKLQEDGRREQYESFLNRL
jgi:hypothetical protein